MRTEYSVPERIGMLGVGIAAAAAVWPTLTTTTGLGMPCVLRSLTGVPCPGCGLTTASIALVHGHLGASAAANPAILGVAALTVVAVPLLGLRAFGVVAAPKPWSDRTRRVIGWGMILLAVASWFFQLHRLGLSPVG